MKSHDAQIGLLSQQAAHRQRGCWWFPMVLVLALCFVGVIGMCFVYGSDVASNVNLKKLPPATILMKNSPLLNVLIVGDWGRHGQYNQSLVAVQMGQIGEKMNIDLVISTGDNFYEEGLTGVDDIAFDESFSRIYTARSLQKPWLSTLGNHDYRGDVLAQLDPKLKLRDSRWNCERSFTLTYSFKGSTCSVQFFFYDTTPFVDQYWRPSKHHYDWRRVEPRDIYLQQQLQILGNSLETSTATWKIVVGHHPIRSAGSHGDTVELREHIYPILKKNSVDLYINGHDHCLEHITAQDSKIHFLTSGGGSKAYRGMNPSANLEGLQFFYDGQGFMALSIAPTTIDTQFYTVLGEVVHGFNLTKGRGAE